MIDFDRIITSDEVTENIENITIKSICEVAEKLFASSEPVLSVIGPDASKYKNY